MGKKSDPKQVEPDTAAADSGAGGGATAAPEAAPDISPDKPTGADPGAGTSSGADFNGADPNGTAPDSGGTDPGINSTGTGSGADPTAPASTDPTLQSLQDELAQAKDAVLRAAAEVQNTRRRAEQDVEKAHKFALERFASDLLPVVDNLERAMEAAGAADAAVKPIAEGVQLTHKSLLDVLARFHIAVIDPQGEPFDPNLHQAMTLVPSPDAEPNTVLEVMQRGYTLSGRLLRPAMVVVSKAVDT